MNDIDNAVLVAARYHSYQYRSNVINGQKMPYLIHPMEVCKKVWQWGVGEEHMLIAAVLHDVVEDSVLSVASIEQQFGPQVAKIVEELTFKTEAMGTEKAKQKADYVATFATKSVEALIIKMADRLINTMDHFFTDRGKCVKYYRKADALFKAFRDRQEEIMLAFGDDVLSAIWLDFDKVTSQVNTALI